MKNEELHDFLTSQGYSYERDSEYNRDVYTNGNVIVEGQKSKIEIYTDRYTARIVWWYNPHNKVSTSAYMKDLSVKGVQMMVRNLVDNNKPDCQKFTAYSDGSCDNLNPQKPGGAAYIIFDSNGQEVKKTSKGFMHTTNNRMELLAILSIVNSLPHNSSVTIYSDSQYSINVLSGRWQASENLDQINKYRNLCFSKNIKVDFVWIRGHNGNEYNELCDKMARSEYRKMKKSSPKPKAKSKSKLKRNLTTWTNALEEQYYNCITTKGRKKKMKT